MRLLASKPGDRLSDPCASGVWVTRFAARDMRKERGLDVVRLVKVFPAFIRPGAG